MGIKDHRANGRVERVVRRLRSGIFKLGDIDFKLKIKKIVETYNGTYHIGLKCSPNEAVEGNRYDVCIENSGEASLQNDLIIHKAQSS